MNARLQQLITITALGWSVLWLWHFLQVGWSAWAVPVVLVPALVLAAVLGLEFLLMSLAHQDDPTPRATPVQIASAWRAELMSAIRTFCWRQPFRSRDYPDLPAFQAAGKSARGVVLVHGYFCNRGFWYSWSKRLTGQGTPFIAVTLEPPFHSIDSVVHLIDAAVSRLQSTTGLPPVVVAHSMGGLVLRRWHAHQDNARRLHHAITLGTPHKGTWLARLGLSTNAQEMRQNSEWLQRLQADECSLRPGWESGFTCFYSHCDNIVFPPITATLPHADNRHLTGVAHVGMVESPQAWEELQRLLHDLPDLPEPRGSIAVRGPDPGLASKEA